MMEPQENDPMELPDYEQVEDEALLPFPPPASPERDSDLETRAPVPVPPKRIVKRNIPKLDAQRLISERGLPTLRHVFDKTKFKGKGHEADDLKKLIRHLEHWAHRLFPKLQFEDFVDRVEFLGNKKEVQTCLKRIRLDLPIVHEDFISNNDEVGENDDHDISATELDPFLTISSGSKSFALEPSQSLTEEQQQRMERNKQLALERRQAKLLRDSQSPGKDWLVDTPGTPATEEVHTNEDQSEEPSGLNEVRVGNTPNDTASTVNVEEQSQCEKPQLDQS